jgi:hypothetical protein
LEIRGTADLEVCATGISPLVWPVGKFVHGIISALSASLREIVFRPSPENEEKKGSRGGAESAEKTYPNA